MVVTIDEHDRGYRPPYSTGKLSIGRTIGGTFQTIGSAWVLFYALSFIVFLVSLPYAIVFAQKMTDFLARAAGPVRTARPAVALGPSFWWTFAGFYSLQILASFYAFGATVHGANQVLTERAGSLGASFRAGLTRFLPMVLSAVMFYVVLVVSFGLLIVPGFIVGAVYGLAPTLSVTERRGPLEGFTRSADLTRDNRWRCIGATLLLLMVPAIVAAIVSKVLTFVIGVQYQFVVAALVNFLLLPIYYVFPAVLAFELKTVKEGLGAGAVANVF